MLARDVATAIAWLPIAGDLKDMRKQSFSTGTERQLAYPGDSGLVTSTWTDYVGSRKFEAEVEQ